MDQMGYGGFRLNTLNMQMNEVNLEFRPYQASDYLPLKKVMQAAFADIEGAYATEEEMFLLSELYPRGQIVCLLNGQLIGATLSRIVPSERFRQPHTQADCIDLSTYVSDAAVGDSVYGLDVFVLPDFQNLKIARKIVTLLKKHVFEDNFRFFLGNSRVSGYHQYRDLMEVYSYYELVKSRELYDPALSFHLSCGMEFVCVNPEFSPDDTASAGLGIMLQEVNLSYNAACPIYPERRAHLARFNPQAA
jgi:hypothetical protein